MLCFWPTVYGTINIAKLFALVYFKLHACIVIYDGSQYTDIIGPSGRSRVLFYSDYTIY